MCHWTQSVPVFTGGDFICIVRTIVILTNSNLGLPFSIVRHSCYLLALWCLFQGFRDGLMVGSSFAFLVNDLWAPIIDCILDIFKSLEKYVLCTHLPILFETVSLLILNPPIPEIIYDICVLLCLALACVVWKGGVEKREGGSLTGLEFIFRLGWPVHQPRILLRTPYLALYVSSLSHGCQSWSQVLVSKENVLLAELPFSGRNFTVSALIFRAPL